MKPYYWQTDYAHADNSATMAEYLDEHTNEMWEICSVDGSYAEILDENKRMWAVHASGNGDFTHHKVEFVSLQI